MFFPAFEDIKPELSRLDLTDREVVEFEVVLVSKVIRVDGEVLDGIDEDLPGPRRFERKKGSGVDSQSSRLVPCAPSFAARRLPVYARLCELCELRGELSRIGVCRGSSGRPPWRP